MLHGVDIQLPSSRFSKSIGHQGRARFRAASADQGGRAPAPRRRARLSSDVSEIKIAFGIPPERPAPNIAPSWNVAPTDPLPVVRYVAKDRQRSLEVMRRGPCRSGRRTLVTGTSCHPRTPLEVLSGPAQSFVQGDRAAWTDRMPFRRIPTSISSPSSTVFTTWATRPARRRMCDNR
jgi:hypothetical protein